MGSKWPIIWEARWIWAADAERGGRQLFSDSRAQREAGNRFCYLRRAIEIATVPDFFFSMP